LSDGRRRKLSGTQQNSAQGWGANVVQVYKVNGLDERVCDRSGCLVEILAELVLKFALSSTVNRSP
jgi:hypothetical protein